MPSEPADFFEILGALARHEVDFLLVGGLAASLSGVPLVTFDVDIMPNPSDENRPRLLNSLLEIEARYLDPAGRHIEPDLEKLATLRIQRLATRFGILDVLAKIGHALTYSDLVERTHWIEIEGLHLRVLDLEMIIRSKEEANREKDRASLPLLRRTLKMERERAGAESSTPGDGSRE